MEREHHNSKVKHEHILIYGLDIFKSAERGSQHEKFLTRLADSPKQSDATNKLDSTITILLKHSAHVREMSLTPM